MPTYLHNALSDIELLFSANSIVADSEIQTAPVALEDVCPGLERMNARHPTLEEALELTEEDGTCWASHKTTIILSEALEQVGQRHLGIRNAPIQLPSYPGLLGISDYVRDMRRALLASLVAAVKLADDEARVMARKGVGRIKALGEVHLPEGVERSRRVLIPEAMISAGGRYP